MARRREQVGTPALRVSLWRRLDRGRRRRPGIEARAGGEIAALPAFCDPAAELGTKAKMRAQTLDRRSQALIAFEGALDLVRRLGQRIEKLFNALQALALALRGRRRGDRRRWPFAPGAPSFGARATAGPSQAGSGGWPSICGPLKSSARNRSVFSSSARVRRTAREMRAKASAASVSLVRVWIEAAQHPHARAEPSPPAARGGAPARTAAEIWICSRSRRDRSWGNDCITQCPATSTHFAIFGA